LQEEERAWEVLREEIERNNEVLEPLITPEVQSIKREYDGFAGLSSVEPSIGMMRARINAIWLIGKFAIFDKNGMNITHLCSNKIKSLFFHIFLSTFFDDGISSDELSDILWPDMDKPRSKVKRGAMMNHLRKIFNDMDGIGLIHDKRSWKISFGNPVYIDLVDLYNKKNDRQQNAMAIIGLYSLGNLKQEDSTPKLDKYMGIFEKEAIQTLISYGNEFFEKQRYVLCNEVAGIIHTNFDELNESALQLKLKSLAKLQHYHKARQEYDHFCQRYKLLMDMEFTIPFDRMAGIE
jgi:two-component SAPR family response regulator